MDKKGLATTLHNLKQLQKDETDHNKNVDTKLRIAVALEKIEVVLEFLALIGMQLLSEEEEVSIPNSNEDFDVS